MATIKKYEGKKGTSWQVRVRKKGKLHSASFPFKKLAQEWALKTEHEISEAHHFPEHKKPTNHTVGELIDLYLERMLPQKAPLTQIKHRHILEWWKKNIGDVTLKNVTPILLDEYKFTLLNKPFDPQTVNSYLNALSPAFTWALSPTMQWLATNPFQHVKRLKEKPGPAPMLTPEETQRLFALCDASASRHLGFFVRLTIGTGGRLQEILHLKWKHINLRRKTVTFIKTKNSEQRTVPLGPDYS